MLYFSTFRSAAFGTLHVEKSSNMAKNLGENEENLVQIPNFEYPNSSLETGCAREKQTKKILGNYSFKYEVFGGIF